jgi:hypothetical protein
MFDRETGTLWTQLEGRAIQGPDQGQRLSHVPSTYTTWDAWKREHPDTLVLLKEGEELSRSGSHYADYFADPERLWMDHLAEGLGGVQPKDVVFGVILDGDSLAVTERFLRSRRVVNAVVSGTPVAWLLDEQTFSSRVVERRLEGRVLLLEPLPGENPSHLFRDRLTGEVHAFDELRPLRVDRAFWYAWRRSHPGSPVISD